MPRRGEVCQRRVCLKNELHLKLLLGAAQREDCVGEEKGKPVRVAWREGGYITYIERGRGSSSE